ARQRAHRLKDLGFLVLHGPEVAARWRFHREERDDLEQVVLNHIAQTAGGLVEGAAAVHTEVFGERDLDARDIQAIPDRFEKRVGESEIEDVDDRLSSEEVIDAEDRVFWKHRVRGAVERACRRQVTAERLFNDDTRVVRQMRRTEPADDGFEERGWNGQIVRRPPGAAEGLPDGGEGRGV